MTLSESNSTHASRLLSFLENPRSYPVHTETVQVVQTHASYVAILDSDVYKIKRDVNLGFLDFSTLEKRKHYCQEEINLNTRLCNNVYIGVVAIYETSKQELTFSESGNPVEYAVHMKRLSDDDFLLISLSEGNSGEEELEKVAIKLEKFYGNAKTSEDIAAYGHPESLRVSTNENFSQIEEYVDSIIDPIQFETVRYFTDRFLTLGDDLLKKRVHSGKVKDCHGDLHLEHIHISGDDICIYDCIEFNDRFRYIDIANDYAFLSMDLDFQDFSYLSRRFVDHIIKATGDDDAYRVIDFYKTYRAVVRSKVNCLTQNNPRLSAEKRSNASNLAKDYFSLAANYAIGGSRPLVIGLTGMVGSGKSALAKRLHNSFGWEWLASDQIRKEIAGVPLFERPDPETRKKLYTREMTDSTYATMIETGSRMIDLGKTVILDATFSSKHHRDLLADLSMNKETGYFLLETYAPEEVLKERLQRRDTHDDEMSDARLEDFEMLLKRYKSPSEIPSHRKIKIDTSGTHFESVLTAIRGVIDSRLDELFAY